MAWGTDEEELDDVEEESTEPENDADEVSGNDGSEDTSASDDGWGADVRDIDDAEVDEKEMPFDEQFSMLVEDGNVEDVTVTDIESDYKEIDDAVILREAIEQDTRSSAVDVYKRRLRQVEDDDAGNSDENSDGKDAEESDTTSPENDTSNESSSDQSNGWGDVDEEDEIEEVDTEDLDDIGVDNLAEDSEDDTSPSIEEPDTTPTASLNDDVSDISEVDLGNVAPNAMSTEEAADQPYLWRILGWALPGQGKTHFGFTMPQPVCIIDTEGKAHNLASKFDDTVTYIWQPDDYDEAREALDEAISVLHQYLKEGHRGTIVVDSISEMWEWSKQKYVSKTMNGKSLDEVNLSSNMGRSGESDWKVIKRFHNTRFREVMLDTPFHLYWTAMQTDDYEAIMEGEDGNPKKPVGERDNPYKVDQILRFVEGPNGEPVGQLQKNGLSKYSFTGLRYPTFPKHKQVCEEVRNLEEEGKDPMLEGVLNGEVTVVEGAPGRWTDDD